MGRSFSIAGGTRNGATVAVADPRVRAGSQILATLDAGQSTGVVGIDIVGAAAGSFTLAVRVSRAGGASAGATTGTYTLADPAFAPDVDGVPVLYGPYVVDYTDIPHDGDKKTLWTPEVGDVLLRLFPDWQSGTDWDTGYLLIGQDLPVPPDLTAPYVDIGYGPFYGTQVHGGLDSLYQATQGNLNAPGTNSESTAYVFHSADPVHIQWAKQTGGSDPARGHVALYALIARPVSP